MNKDQTTAPENKENWTKEDLESELPIFLFNKFTEKIAEEEDPAYKKQVEEFAKRYPYAGTKSPIAFMYLGFIGGLESGMELAKTIIEGANNEE